MEKIYVFSEELCEFKRDTALYSTVNCKWHYCKVEAFRNSNKIETATTRPCEVTESRVTECWGAWCVKVTDALLIPWLKSYKLALALISAQKLCAGRCNGFPWPQVQWQASDVVIKACRHWTLEQWKRVLWSYKTFLCLAESGFGRCQENVTCLIVSRSQTFRLTAEGRGVMPIQSEGHVPPQIFEPSGFWMQLPKDKKQPNNIF